ncbi:ACT domain-containing protein [Salinisphaera aquimarina]|uniref:ACT domain-containing protein n=1 Tax=Salinisphaera aquimarina TaxID=2094031 RepID=A0ABV7EU56_9GAMM
MTAVAGNASTKTSLLLAQLAPIRQPGIYVFARIADDVHIDPGACLCVMNEPEGRSIIADIQHLPVGAVMTDYRAAWITLAVASRLEDVGLTAAVAQCLATAGISCNVVAGVRHDHLFVPLEAADRTLSLLETLQHEARDALARADIRAAESGAPT